MKSLCRLVQTVLPLFTVVLATGASLAQEIGVVFPGKQWARKTPAEVGLDPGRLKEFSQFVGGRGCVVRHGYLVYSWGDVSRRADVASACKPFYSHFLFKAVEDGKIKSTEEKVIKWEPRLGQINRALGFKDRAIRWRDFANQTSCYQLVEKPGTAFAYNDWQMALFWDTLFLKVYRATYNSVDEKVFHPLLTDLIQCQDNPTMMAFGTRDRQGRIAISVRDFARFGLLYLRKGNWRGRQLISREHAVIAITSPLPNSIPRAGRKAAEMIPGQRSHGSTRKPDNQTDHFGSYSWLWWINGVDRKGMRFWPDAPKDTFGAFGHGGPRAMWVIPSLNIVVSYNDAQLRGWYSGEKSPTNQAMKRLVAAVDKQESETGALQRRATTRFVSAVEAGDDDRPYPPSRTIRNAEFDFSTHDRRAPGSDNWPITWADDGHQYAAWGDGGGFGGTNSDGRVSLGVARVEGPHEKYRGVNVWGGKNAENPAQFGGKSYGILCVDGVLYMWVGPGSNTTSYREARLHKSTDHGATWTKADWAFTKSDRLIMPTLLQFGKDYAGAVDDYVYSYAIRLQGKPSRLDVHKPGQIDLMRVPKSKIMDRSAYEFFSGLDSKAQPAWSKDLKSRRPVFEDPRGVGWCMSVSYNAGLRRYLLCTEHDVTKRGNLGIFDAPQPWGPWTTVAYESNWGKFGSTFYWNFSNKWLSKDGRNFTIIFTGTGRNDSWNTVRGTFGLRD